ncbi:MAG TPA: M23 family metallopeptidase [Acidimicrobiales bacterium]|nr:M23 family metallopeptidase [Acidimicrobiales bacterium]
MAGITRTLGVAALGVSLSLVSATPVAADQTTDTVNQSHAQGLQEGTILPQLWQQEAAVAKLDAQVACANAQLAQVQPALQAAQAAEATAAQTDEAATFRLEIAQAQLDSARQSLHRFAIDAYVEPPTAGLPELLSGAENAGTMMAAPEYLKAAAQTQGDAISAFRQAQESLTSARRQSTQAHDAARAALAHVATRQAALASAQQQAATLQTEAAGQENAITQSIQLLQWSRQALDASLGTTSQPDSVTSVITAAEGAPPAGWQAPQPGALKFVLPVGNVPITSPFGPRINPITNSVENHPGVDFAAPDQTPIGAALAGTVIWAGPLGGYGNATIIDNGAFVSDLYGHQSQILVKVGDQVAAGQIIGLEGSTGESTGPHLHFEVRVRGVVQDPFPYLLNALLAAPTMLPGPTQACQS